MATDETQCLINTTCKCKIRHTNVVGMFFFIIVIYIFYTIRGYRLIKYLTRVMTRSRGPTVLIGWLVSPVIG